MDQDDRIYKAFLAEMQELEGFRLSYVAEHPNAPLTREDPDTRRLVEAMAFFAARTRLASRESISVMRRRILRQLMPYVVAPLPAMAMVQALPTGRFAEVATLPRGTELELRAPGRPPGLFRTLRELRVLPLQIVRTDMVPGPRGGTRALVTLRTPFKRNDAISRLAFHIDYLDDFTASLTLERALRKHLQRVTVSFGEQVDEHTPGAPCDVSFGLPPADLAEEWPHPIQRERAWFHFPVADLVMNVDVPEPPRNWQQLTLCLDLAPEWPRTLRLARNVLRLFTTPVVNLQRAMAQPIVSDGTQERWPIRFPRPAQRFALQSVRGVYRVAEGALVPLRAGTLAGGSGSYEIGHEAEPDGSRHHSLWLHMPEAFRDKVTVAVDAEWLQPWFSQHVGENLTAQPYRRSVAGLDWDVSAAVPHRAVSTEDDMDELMHVLVLQHKSRLDRDDLIALLQGLGSVWAGQFAPLRTLLQKVEVRDVPLSKAQGASGLKLVYELVLAEHDKAHDPLVEVFAEHVARILDAWVGEMPVEVRVRSA
jgi:type VI secretion system protein ImpG